MMLNQLRSRREGYTVRRGSTGYVLACCTRPLGRVEIEA
jgi:hypothetical protein